MNQETNIEMEVLRQDMDNLKAEFAKLGDMLRESLKHVSDGATREARRAGEKAWSETRSKAEEVISQIEEKPVTSAAIAFGVGLLLGLLFGRRH